MLVQDLLLHLHEHTQNITTSGAECLQGMGGKLMVPGAILLLIPPPYVKKSKVVTTYIIQNPIADA